MPESTIKIVGARQHNLKNLSVEIPRHQLVVITGVSGSGKSSLAFDTLYAEGQRRYVESLSAYARQFLDQLEKPDVDFIEGLSPAIAIEQRTSATNPRSTIATTTEIYDYLRILYAAIGVPHDPETGEELTRHTPHAIIEALLAQPEKTKVILLAPVEPSEEGDLPTLLERLKKQGFLRARIDGEIYDLEGGEPLPEGPAETVEVVVDRLVIREGIRSRLADSVETTLRWSTDRMAALVQTPDATEWDYETFTTTFYNPATGFTLPRLTPRHFSFNSHLGACPVCHGLGTQMRCDPALLVPDPEKSLRQGAVKTWWAKNKKLRATQDRQIFAVAEHFGQDLDEPFESLSGEFKKALFFGSGKTPIKSGWKTGPNTRSVAKPFEGLVPQAERLWETSESQFTKRNVQRYMNALPCPACEGKRLKPAILAVTLPHGPGEAKSIQGFTAQSIEAALGWLDGITLTRSQQTFAPEVIREIRKRLQFLNDVGLGYLTLDRESGTLSGGESQRIRLATQLGAGLAGVLYVLDEPSIGLHQSDNEKLIGTLKDLRDLGNTVIVVEHDEDAIRAADHVLDLGPGAGRAGGEMLAQGTPEEIARDPASVTGAYLSGKKAIPIPARRVPPNAAAGKDLLDSGWLTVKGAAEHNLKDVTAAFPLGCLVAVTGVSGSGKSTLVDDILRRAVFRKLYQSKERPGAHAAIEGLDGIDKAIVIDQSPIGRSPRSNPSTYIGVFGPIRDLFAQLPASRARGYEPGRFSFNVAGGRCEACQGDGVIKIDMHFLSDVYVTCETCGGRRYNRETLDVTYRGKNIADILDMTVAEALTFFQKIPAIYQKLRALRDVGLGYVQLGQSATTLSGGEAQRIKLAAELGKSATGKTLYLLDEPTTGLHFEDIAVLLDVFFRLRDQGNTLVVIEHNLDVIKCADWVLDLGPGGGQHGGQLIAQGTPEQIAANKKSVTGRYLKRLLA